MLAVIICNGKAGEYGDYREYFDKASMIICCDGGARHLKKFGITPDVMLGDFDSVSDEDLQDLKLKNTQIIKYPVNKDFTDSEIAVDYAIEKGAKQIVLIAALGDREDHSIANIMLLKKILSAGVEGLVVDPKNVATLINKEKTFANSGGFLSLIPLTETVTGVTTNGLSFPLKDAVMEMGTTWGISNEFVADTAKVTLKSGILLAILSKE